MMDSSGRGIKTGEAVAAGIRRRIATGDLPLGARLPTEEELTESFGIARTTLREALRILEFQGLITIKRGRGGGATVTMPDLERLAEPLAVVLQLRKTSSGDLDEARRLIEPQLAGWLAKHHSEDDLAALRAAVAAATQAADTNDQAAFGTAAANMHSTIIERGGNNTLSVIAQLLHTLLVDRYTTAAMNADQALMRRAARSYWKLVDLITDGEVERANEHWESQMTWVLSESADRPLDFYASPSPGKDKRPRRKS
ncbi:MAG: regulatory protein GntR [Ilumatobacteraceae bacterium]|nr:regulatory protein GntR [Ilumatobacteraceae bacterium]